MSEGKYESFWEKLKEHLEENIAACETARSIQTRRVSKASIAGIKKGLTEARELMDKIEKDTK